MISPLDQDFSQLNHFLTEMKPTKLFFLVDENTHEHCLPTLLTNLETELPFEIIEIEPGEEMKTIETATHLWEILAEFQADRKSLLINLGGGVITDMGGFVASTYKRGIRFINIPTTLLGICDASIGGKTGIDHGFLKNIVGTFALPERIFVYPNFLLTLPFTELRSGFAEMLKHGLIADETHWKDLISIYELSAENVAPHIEKSMKIKQDVVEKDFKERNIRKTLNFGHTVGHAVESLFMAGEKPIPHGEAVAIGMICETKLSELSGLISPETADEVMNGIRKFFPYVRIDDFKNEDLLKLMLNDKKNDGSTISFSLITEIGSCGYDIHCDTDNINTSLNFYKFELNK